MAATDEIFDLVDETGRVIGQAPRRVCHGNPALLHPVVHVHVRDAQGRLFLQRRALTKDIQPGKWDTSVGGHMHPGEAPEVAARREMEEELGIRPAQLVLAYQYIWRSPVESELVRTYVATSEGPFRLQVEEIDEGRFWAMPDIAAALSRGIFTPNFAVEFERYRQWLAKAGG